MSSTIREKLCREIKTAGEAQGWLDAPGILVALSGGGDSMALLSLLLICFGGRVAAAHLEHGLRGEPSIRDAEFVEDYCARAGVHCFVRRADVAGCRLAGESAEMAGRRIRYEFFDEIARGENLPFIATGHNADDAVETMLQHIFRGTGVAGLSGISARRGRIVRPLISCARTELRQFLAESGIPWREDETNDENHYQRNKIRNQLIPWVRANINRSFERAMLGLASESAEMNAKRAGESEASLALVSREHPFALAAWDAAAAKRLSPARLSSALRAQGAKLALPVLDRSRLSQLCRLMSSSGRWRFQWADDVEVCGGGPLLGWIPRSLLRPPAGTGVRIRRGERAALKWGLWDVVLELELRDGGKLKNNVWSALLPASGEECDISVSCVFDLNKKDKRRILCAKIPWWSSYNMPIISWKNENRDETWQPGSINCVRGSGDYVIIAKVFAQAKHPLSL
ncbi:MAG: tRNA lysidine(34) synthetase TilS [Synergistaceae bacterium]|jgi:tRNA(Ile)-lysidine synthase|nr:tRNA lysidine(34) synthetase TilS [Synergistaceae bacterium]